MNCTVKDVLLLNVNFSLITLLYHLQVPRKTYLSYYLTSFCPWNPWNQNFLKVKVKVLHVFHVYGKVFDKTIGISNHSLLQICSRSSQINIVFLNKMNNEFHFILITQLYKYLKLFKVSNLNISYLSNQPVVLLSVAYLMKQKLNKQPCYHRPHFD